MHFAMTSFIPSPHLAYEHMTAIKISHFPWQHQHFEPTLEGSPFPFPLSLSLSLSLSPPPLSLPPPLLYMQEQRHLMEGKITLPLHSLHTHTVHAYATHTHTHIHTHTHTHTHIHTHTQADVPRIDMPAHYTRWC